MSGFGRKLQQASHHGGVTGVTGALSLTPNSGTYAVGGSLVVTIYEDSQATSVNSVQANLTYDPAVLQWQSSDASGGSFTTALQNTGGSGLVQLGVGTLSGSVTGSKVVGTVVFTVLAAGNTAVTFANGSAIYRSSDAVNILATSSGASYATAVGGDIILSAATGTFSNGASVVVTVREDSQAVAVNSAQINLSYDPSILQWQSSDASAGAFTTVLQNTGGSGLVQLGVGTLSGSATGNSLVGTVTFTAIGSGDVSVAVTTGAAIYRSSDATNILVGGSLVRYHVS